MAVAVQGRLSPLCKIRTLCATTVVAEHGAWQSYGSDLKCSTGMRAPQPANVSSAPPPVWDAESPSEKWRSVRKGMTLWSKDTNLPRQK
eukprot:5039792-Amphidinium_carterae.1